MLAKEASPPPPLYPRLDVDLVEDIFEECLNIGVVRLKQVACVIVGEEERVAESREWLNRDVVGGFTLQESFVDDFLPEFHEEILFFFDRRDFGDFFDFRESLVSEFFEEGWRRIFDVRFHARFVREVLVDQRGTLLVEQLQSGLAGRDLPDSIELFEFLTLQLLEEVELLSHVARVHGWTLAVDAVGLEEGVHVVVLRFALVGVAEILLVEVVANGVRVFGVEIFRWVETVLL